MDRILPAPAGAAKAVIGYTGGPACPIVVADIALRFAIAALCFAQAPLPRTPLYRMPPSLMPLYRMLPGC